MHYLLDELLHKVTIEFTTITYSRHGNVVHGKVRCKYRRVLIDVGFVLSHACHAANVVFAYN
jgi:hypothetical protein